jgi:hypothetical protein
MVEIYSNENLKIIEDKQNSIFRMDFSYRNDILIRSLIKTRIIQGATATDDYKRLRFKAVSIKSLNEYQEDRKKVTGTNKLTILETASLIADLTAQLKYLITVESHTIIGYSSANIIVINDKKFAFVGAEFVTEIEYNNQTLISYPFNLSEFYVSPELLKIQELPSYIHYKTAYFSLGCLALYALLYDNEFYTEYLKKKHPEKIMNSLDLHSIKHTKLYWLLSRCLTEDAERRSILFL